MTRLALSLIVRDPEVQPRESMDHDLVTQYAEDMLAGIDLPPVVVFHDGARHWLAEGFHRTEGAEQAGLEDIEADIRPGTRADALWHAAGSNKEHDKGGLRRSTKDKERAIKMALRHPNALRMPNTAVATHCGVSDRMVSKHREIIFENFEDDGVRTISRTINGKLHTYTMQVGNIGRPTGPVTFTPHGVIEHRPTAEEIDAAADRLRAVGAEPFFCPGCGDVFSEAVWHCPGCDHHCLDGVEDCKYCHDYERRPDGSIVRIEHDLDPDELDEPNEPEADPPLADEPPADEPPADEPPADVPAAPLFVLDGEPGPPKPPGRPTFNQTNEMVEWAWWTWNPVTGCEHTCVYCLTPETPILHADMSWRPIGDVQIGDALLGFDEYPAPGKTRKLRPSVVENVWRHVRPVKAVRTESGVVRATDDHLWLTHDGRWTPTHRLRPGRSLRRISVVNPAVEDMEYRAGYIEAMTIGDGTYRYVPGQGSSSSGDPQCYWRVALVDTEPLLRLVHFLGCYGVDVNIRAFNSGSPLSIRPMFKVETRSLANLQIIHSLLNGTRPVEGPEYMAGFLAGFFDAEGHSGKSLTGSHLRMTQKDEVVLRRVQDYGRRLGFDFLLESFNQPCKTVRLVGPLRDRLRFFSACRPAIARKMESVFDLGLDMEADQIVSVEDEVDMQEVVDIQTSTRTFIANGLATHNCYARDIANRFYPEKFAPTYRPERLEAPRNTHRPDKAKEEIGWRNVFVCSMADLFGRWVPEEWIEGVFASCRRSPEWNYLFLTKFPNRYEDLDFPATAWVGTSVDEQRRVAGAEKAFAKVRGKVPVTWLSVEPLREPLKFARLDLFDWIVIGGQSRSSQAPEFLPPFTWVADLVVEAKRAGCKVYIKPNIGFDGPTRPREYPGAAGPEGGAP